MSPEEALMITPAGAVNEPPVCPACVAVAVPVAQYGEPAYTIVAVGSAFIVTEVEVVLLQVPFVNVYVIVYVPGVLVARSIVPVKAVIDTPAGAVYVPPAVP